MKKSLYSQIAEVVLCAGVIITLVWGCNNVPQDNQNLSTLGVDNCEVCQEVDSLYKVAQNLIGKDIKEAMEIAKLMLVKAQSKSYKKGEANAYNMIGAINLYQGDFEAAKNNFELCLQKRTETDDTLGMAGTYSNLGTVYSRQGDYEKSLQNYIKAAKVYEVIGSDADVADMQINIGSLFYDQKNGEMAMDYYLKAKQRIEKDSTDIDCKRRLSSIHNNIGMIFADERKVEKALDNYFKALKLAEETGNKVKISNVSNNLGNLYKETKNYSLALNYYDKGLELFEEIGDKDGTAICLENIGSIMVAKKDYENAERYFNRSLNLANEIGSKKVVMEVYERLSDLYAELGNDLALKFCRLNSKLREELLGEANQQQIAQMQTIYETDKKDNEIKLLNKDKEVQESENKKQRIIIYTVLGGAVLLLAFAFVAYRAYKSKKRANLHLAKQKQEIEIQKNEITHQKADIDASITYAKRIQGAIMPSISAFQKRLPNSFVLFKPKDNVSGDFYWMETKGEITFFAAADCTGHGVPGAMVSMVCSDVLNRCVKEFGLVKPGEILNKATELVIEAFEKSEEAIQDGMDISLCALNSETDELLWSGANNPLYLVTTQLTEYKADKQHIGKHDHQKSFTTHRIKLYPGDSFYIFSDGYPTQIGGPEGPAGKKFMSKKFKNLLVSIQERNMEGQRDVLNQAIEEWMKPEPNLAYEQTDDILVIGVRI